MTEIEFQNILFYKHPFYKDYFASECGQILSLKRKNKKILKFGNRGRGYFQFCLCVNNTKKYYSVSRFIFECFNGVIPLDKDVDHVNNDKKNNSINNLQLLTRKENVRKSCCKKLISFNIVTQEEKIFDSLSQAAEFHKINISTVCSNCQKINKITKSKKDGMLYEFFYL